MHDETRNEDGARVVCVCVCVCACVCESRVLVYELFLYQSVLGVFPKIESGGSSRISTGTTSYNITNAEISTESKS
jgi:hypothetical protein